MRMITVILMLAGVCPVLSQRMQIEHLKREIIDLNEVAYTVRMKNGAPPYSYEWTGPEGMRDVERSLLARVPGRYCVRITDSECRRCDTCFVVTAAATLPLKAVEETEEPPAEENSGPGTREVQAGGMAEDFVSSVHPNPGRGRLYLDIQRRTREALIIDIVDMNNRPVRRIRDAGGRVQWRVGLDFSEVPTGSYLINIYSPVYGQRALHKVVIVD